MESLIDTLRRHGIRPTPQRLAVARHVLRADDHPTADQVLAAVRRDVPTISRATVYNTLNLLVAQGLLVTRLLREGAVVFDPRREPHHHLVDEETGEIHDVPWDRLRVEGIEECRDFEVRDYHVVLRGRRRR